MARCPDPQSSMWAAHFLVPEKLPRGSGVQSNRESNTQRNRESNRERSISSRDGIITSPAAIWGELIIFPSFLPNSD